MGHRPHRKKRSKKRVSHQFRASQRRLGAIARAFVWLTVAALAAAPSSVFVGGS